MAARPASAAASAAPGQFHPDGDPRGGQETEPGPPGPQAAELFVLLVQTVLLGGQGNLRPLLNRRPSPRDVKEAAVLVHRVMASGDAGKGVLLVIEPPGHQETADRGDDQQARREI